MFPEDYSFVIIQLDNNKSMIFKNRLEAGQKLAEKLIKYKDQNIYGPNCPYIKCNENPNKKNKMKLKEVSQ